MRMHFKGIALGVVVYMFNLLGPGHLTAQSILYDYENKPWIRVEINKPFFEEDDEYGFTTSTNFINGQIPLTDQIALTGEIPISIYDFESPVPIFDEPETNVGNIGLGGTFRSESGSFLGELLFRIPTLPNDASVIGGLDIERLNAFAADDFSIRLLGNLIHNVEKGLYYRIRGGFNGIFFEDESELYFQLGALLGYAIKQAKFNVNLISVTHLSEEYDEFTDRNINQFQFGAEYGSGNFKPSLFFRIPLENEFIVNITLGVGATYIIE